MGKKVGDDELRLAFFFADADFNLGAVPENNNAVKRHRNCRPLVFFYSAVVTGFEKCKLVGFIERIGLEIKTGRVDMSRRYSDALTDALFAHYGKDHRLVAVEIINLVAGGILLELVEGNEAVFLRLGNNKACNLSLGLVAVEEFFIILGIIHCFCKLRFVNKVCAVLLVYKQFFA